MNNLNVSDHNRQGIAISLQNNDVQNANQVEAPNLESEMQALHGSSKVWEDIIKKGKAEDSHFVANHSMLRHRPWSRQNNVDFNILALLNGDAFVGSTKMGYNTPDALNHYIQFFENLLLNQNRDECSDLLQHTHHVAAFIPKLKACKAISERFQKITNDGMNLEDEARKKLIDDYAKELSDDFAKGKIDWFPSGWYDTSAHGHALYLHLDKARNSCSIINTGSGLNYHPSITQHSKDELHSTGKFKTKHQQVLTFTDVDKERLGSKDFFKFLLEASVKPSWCGQLRPNATIFYKGLQKYLGGKEAPAYNPQTHPYMYKTSQRAGSCAVKSPGTSFYYFMCGLFESKENEPVKAVASYKKIKYLWEREALLSHCGGILEKFKSPYLVDKDYLDFDDSSVQFYEDMMQNMEREAEELFEKKQLTSDDLVKLHATFLDIREMVGRIIESKKKILTFINERKFDFSIPRDCAPNIASIKVSEFNKSEEDGAENASEHENPCQPLVNALTNKEITPFVPEKATESLDDLVATFNPLYKMHSENVFQLSYFYDLSSTAHKFFDKVLAHLPIPDSTENDNSYWSKIPEDQILPCMRSLRKLMYICNGFVANKHGASTLTVQYGFLAVMDKLARRLPETNLPNGVNINYYGLMKEITSPDFIIHNPEIQEKLKKIVAYFDPKFSFHDRKRTVHEWNVFEKQSLFSFANANVFQVNFDIEDINKDLYLKYMSQFVRWDDPDFKQSMTIRKVTQEDSFRDQLRAMLSNKPLIPESVKLLQEAVLQSTMMHEGELRNFSLDSPKFPFFELNRGIGHWYHSEAFCKRKSETHREGNPSPNLNEVAGKERYGDEARAIKKFKNYEKDSRGQNDLVHDAKKEELDEEGLHIALQPVDSYDEVNRTLSFAHRNLALLTHEYVQNQITIHLFKPERIFSQLKDRAKFAEQIITFLEDALSYHNKCGNQETSLFLIKLGYQLEKFVKKCGVVTSRPFPNFGKMILDELLVLDNHPVSIRQCAAEIVSWYHPDEDRNEIDEDQLAVLTEAAILYNVSNVMRPDSTSRKLPMRTIEKNWETAIKTLMHENVPLRNKILNQVLSLFAKSNSTNNWEGEFPLFKSGEFQIDVVKGVISQKGKSFTFLPDKILDHADFKKLGIQDFSHVVKKGSDSYLIYPDEIVVSIDSSKRLLIEKRIDHEIYHFLPDFDYSSYPTLFSETTKFWKHPSSSHCLALTSGQKSIRINLERKVVAIPVRERFVNENGNFDYRTTSVDRPIAIVSTIERDGQVFVPFEKLPADLKLTIRKSRIPDNTIECWYSKEGKTKKVDSIILTSLNLHFKIRHANKVLRAYCQEIPGFYLSENSYLSHLGEEDCYIYLENAAGEKKVILPNYKLENQFKEVHGFAKNEIGYPESFCKGSHSKPYYEYIVQDGTVSSTVVENRLYLGYLYSAKREYGLCSTLLTKLNATSSFTKSETNLIVHTLSLLKGDKHPSARLLYLQLYSLYEENRLKFPRSVGEKRESVAAWNDFIAVYQDFYQKEGNAHNAHFTEWDEKRMLLPIKKELEEARRKGMPSNEYEEAGHALRLIDERLYDLKARSSLKSAKIVDGKVEEESKHFGYSDVEHLFKKYKREDYPFFDNVFSDDSLICLNPREFIERFVYFYDVATSDSALARRKLKVYLDFNKGNLEDGVKKYHEHLLRVCEYHSEYPIFDEIKKCFDEYDSRDSGNATARWKNLKNIIEKATKKIDKPLEVRAQVANVAKKAFANSERVKWDANKAENALSSPLYFDGVNLGRIDKAFNQFFQQIENQFFTHKDVAVEAIAPLLPEDHSNPLVREKLKQENADLKEYDKIRAKTKRIFSMRNQSDVKQLYTAIKAEEQRWDATLKTQIQALLWQANRVPADRDANRLKALKRSGYQKRVTWDDLKRCFLKGDRESFSAITELNDQEIQNLFYGIGDYSLKKCRLDQLKHVLKALETFEKVNKDINDKRKELSDLEQSRSDGSWSSFFLGKPKWDKSSIANAEKIEKEIKNLQVKENHFLQHLVSTIKMFPAFEITNDRKPEILFQLANGYFYREEQIKKQDELLETLKKEPEILAQMRTGFGKTKATIPTEDVKLDEKGNLVVDVWPASIEETNTGDVKVQMDKSWARQVDAMKFDRSTNISKASLEKRYSDILLDIKLGRPLNVRPETIRALETHLIFLFDLTETEKKPSPKNRVQLQFITKILAICRLKGIGFIDEARHNLDPRDKLIYTKGVAQTMSEEELDVTEMLFDTLTDPPYDKLFDFGNNNANRVTEAQFNQVRVDLVKIFERKLNIEPLFAKDFANFILGEREDPPYWFALHPKRKEIATLRGQLLYILDTCCRGSVDRSFGLSKKHESVEFAIPYISADTPKETVRAPSECKNPHEALDKTYITYLFKGLNDKQVVKFIEHLQGLALKQVNVDLNFEKTEAYKFFKLVCPNSRKPLNALKKEDIAQIASTIKKNKKAVFFYIKNIIAPQIKCYAKTITSTTQNMRSQFAKSVSVTATPQDIGAHGPDSFYIPVKGTSGQVRHVLYTKCKSSKTIKEIRAQTNEGMRQEALKLGLSDPGIRATIDIGSFNKGVTNVQWAKETCQLLREKKSPITAVVYYENHGDKEQFMIMDVATGQTQPFEGNNIDPDERYTVYDEYRAYGSDIPQDHYAKSLILLCKDNTFTKVAQGYGRMNRSGKMNMNQTPIFAVPTYLQQEIFKGKQPNIDDLNVFLIANETEEIAQFNKESLIDQMDNELRRALLDKIMGIEVDKANSKENEQKNAADINVDVDKAIKIFNKVNKELISTHTYDPCDMYAYTTKTEETVAFLTRYLEKCKLIVKNCQGLNENEKKHVLQRLEKYVTRWKGDNKLILPPLVKATSTSLGISCDVFHEVETKTEVNTQVNQQIQNQRSDLLKPVEWDDTLDIYSKGWETPKLVLTKENIFKRTAIKVVVVVVSIFVKFHSMSASKKLAVVAVNIAAVALFSIPLMVLTIMAWATNFFARSSFSNRDMNDLKAFVSNFYRKKYSGMTGYLKEVLEHDLPEESKNAAKLYNKNFLVSDNFYQRNDIYAKKQEMQLAFSEEQKPLFQVLAIQDRVGNKKQLQFMAIDQNDSKFFRKKLQMDKETTVAAANLRTRKVAVVDVHTGKIVSEGKNGFDESELESQAEFHEMMTQAKLLDGQTHYSAQEEICLKKGVKQVGQLPLKKYFEGSVLPLHPRSRSLYPSKPIFTILNGSGRR